MAGPLDDYRIIELGGIGPVPFAGMLLADLGARVLRLDRMDRAGSDGQQQDVARRGKQSARIDLKHPGARHLLLDLVARADALIEGFRPGVAERLGLGPEDCRQRNPKLVYGRMTGFGQTGPLSQAAGHDINYIALSGSLSLIGRAGEPPVPPVNLLGDYAGGGMLLVLGIVSALLERTKSQLGQVVDASMVDGAALLAAAAYGAIQSGRRGPRGTNLVDSGAWFYEVYETADGRFVSVGSLEQDFYDQMLDLTGLAKDADRQGPVPDRSDPATWPDMKRRMAALMKTRTRDEWCEIMEGTDACFAPVLDAAEAHTHFHNVERGTFINIGGVVQPAPAPRFGRSRPATPREPTDDSGEGLENWGVSSAQLAELRAAGAIA
jgi:alpha-methylacyl-CoA racemase